MKLFDNDITQIQKFFIVLFFVTFYLSLCYLFINYYPNLDQLILYVFPDHHSFAQHIKLIEDYSILEFFSAFRTEYFLVILLLGRTLFGDYAVQLLPFLGVVLYVVIIFVSSLKLKEFQNVYIATCLFFLFIPFNFQWVVLIHRDIWFLNGCLLCVLPLLFLNSSPRLEWMSIISAFSCFAIGLVLMALTRNYLLVWFIFVISTAGGVSFLVKKAPLVRRLVLWLSLTLLSFMGLELSDDTQNLWAVSGWRNGMISVAVEITSFSDCRIFQVVKQRQACDASGSVSLNARAESLNARTEDELSQRDADVLEDGNEYINNVGERFAFFPGDYSTDFVAQALNNSESILFGRILFGAFRFVGQVEGIWFISQITHSGNQPLLNALFLASTVIQNTLFVFISILSSLYLLFSRHIFACILVSFLLGLIVAVYSVVPNFFTSSRLIASFGISICVITGYNMLLARRAVYEK